MKYEERARATVAIVKAYLDGNKLSPSELPALIEAIGEVLMELEARGDGGSGDFDPVRLVESVRGFVATNASKPGQALPSPTRH